MEQLLNAARSGGGLGGGGLPPLESMLGPEFAGKDLAKEADKLWKFLDNLAEDDPQAYAKFVKSQALAAEAEQNKQLVKGASAQVVIEAWASEPASCPAVVHVWAARDGKLVPMATASNGAHEVSASTTSWSGTHVPLFECYAPRLPQQSSQAHAPSSSSRSRQARGEEPALAPAPAAVPAAACQFHLGVHPKLMPMLTLNQPPQMRPILVEAALQFVESRHPVKFDRTKQSVFKVHKGQLEVASRAMAAAAEAGRGATTSSPHDLIHAMASMQHESEGSGEASGSAGLGSGHGRAHLAAAVHGPQGSGKPSATQPQGKQLIQEVDALTPQNPSPKQQQQQQNPSPQQQQSPSLQQQQDSAPQQQAPSAGEGGGIRVLCVQRVSKHGKECLCIEAEMPGAESVQDVSVEFTEPADSPTPGDAQTAQVIVLGVLGESRCVQLPCSVDDSRCSAKFDKRKRLLKLTVPVT